MIKSLLLSYLSLSNPNRLFSLSLIFLILSMNSLYLLPSRLLLISQMNEGISIPSLKSNIMTTWGQLPLSFEVNQGQTSGQVKFLSRGSSYSLFLTATEAILRLAKPPINFPDTKTILDTSTNAVLHMQFVDANTASKVVGLEELPGKTNYFIGNNPKTWKTNVANFAKVKYQDVYPGIDMIYYGNQQQLEYDFVVKPAANSENIQLNFQGADEIEIDSDGNLILHISDQQIQMHRPFIYQEIDGVKKEISGGYVLKDNHQVGFRLGTYDTFKTLTIDPVLNYSTFLGGGAQDESFGIAVDTYGAAYITGDTHSSNFPTTFGAFDTTNGGNWDAFVTKLDPSGSTMVYSTFIGGSGAEGTHDIVVNTTGSAYITGSVFNSSYDFPTTPGAFDTSFNDGGSDAFVTKLSPTGSILEYSTFLGGRGTFAIGSGGEDYGFGIALDANGATYVSGFTYSSDFPTTSGSFDTSWNSNFDVFVTKLDPTGSTLSYSTFIGGSDTEEGLDIAIDGSGAAYVTGESHSTNFPTTAGAFDTDCSTDGICEHDVFVTKLDSTGSMLVYSTFLGGGHIEVGTSIAIDGSGAAYITGSTRSSDFPTTTGSFDTSFNGGVYDIFITKLNSTGSALVYSTFLGDTDVDFGEDIAVDAANIVYVVGSTGSPSFPTTIGAFDITCGTDGFCDSQDDAVLTVLTPTGDALVYSTFLGGSGSDSASTIALSTSGAIYISGRTDSTDFPLTVSAFDTSFNDILGSTDAFVAKIVISDPSALIENLTDVVISFNLQQGIENSFDTKLQNANDALLSVNAQLRQDAVNKLQSFILAVEAQRNKEITSSQADILVTRANEIIATLQ